MDDVEQLKLMLKKYLEVMVDTHLTASGHTKVEVVISFDGEEITKSSNYVLKPE
jgi:hypothetical protein